MWCKVPNPALNRSRPNQWHGRKSGKQGGRPGELGRDCDTRSRVSLLDTARRLYSSYGVVSPVPALRGRRWQRRGLKHSVAAGKASRTPDLLREMMGRDNVYEASVLRIVTSAELERPFGSRAKTAWGSGSVGINGLPTHA